MRDASILQVRLGAEDKETIRRASECVAAREGGGGLSSWVRRTLLAEARRELAMSVDSQRNNS